MDIVIIFYDPPKEEDKDGLTLFSHLKKILIKESLSKKEWDDFLRKRYGWAKFVDNHPKMRAMHEFVENIRDLEVQKDSRVRKGCRKEKEKYLNELLEYLREALENLDWKGCQGLMKIFQMAITEEKYIPYEPPNRKNNRIKVHLAIEKYYHKKVGEIIARAGSKPTKPYFILPEKLLKSTELPSALEVLDGETLEIISSISYPSREDLAELLPDLNEKDIEKAVEWARGLNYTIRNLPPWGSTSR